MPIISLNKHLLIFATSLCLASFSSRAEVVDRIVALVNSEIVSQSDLELFSKSLSRPGSVDELLLGNLALKDLKENRQAQLDYLISEKIVDSEIKRLHLSVTSARVEQEIADLAKKNKMSKTDLIKAIRDEGMSISTYQSMIKNRIERQSLIENEISSKVRVSDEEILGAYLQKNPKSSSRVFEYNLSHILFNPKKGGTEAAQKRAASVLEKLKAGESFETLAEQNSEDANFSAQGTLGSFKSTELTPEFEAAVRDLEVGEFSSVVHSRSGFHILKVTGKKVVVDPEFEKQKEKLRASLFEKSFHKAFNDWLTMKRRDSSIRINE